jgi:hypothetical protein
MNKEFAPYEQSLAIKELGFDEPCFGYYVGLGDNKEKPFTLVEIQSEKGQFEWIDNVYHAPLYQQAFRWFREKYEYISFIRGRKSMGFDYTLSDVPTDLSKRDTFQSPYVYQTYEEAELACLIKLIEIAKTK